MFMVTCKGLLTGVHLQEEVRGWDVNEVLFDDGMWQVRCGCGAGSRQHKPETVSSKRG